MVSWHSSVWLPKGETGENWDSIKLLIVEDLPPPLSSWVYPHKTPSIHGIQWYGATVSTKTCQEYESEWINLQGVIKTWCELMWLIWHWVDKVSVLTNKDAATLSVAPCNHTNDLSFIAHVTGQLLEQFLARLEILEIKIGNLQQLYQQLPDHVGKTMP